MSYLKVKFGIAFLYSVSIVCYCLKYSIRGMGIKKGVPLYSNLC
jgi:hypothetical protein